MNDWTICNNILLSNNDIPWSYILSQNVYLLYIKFDSWDLKSSHPMTDRAFNTVILKIPVICEFLIQWILSNSFILPITKFEAAYFWNSEKSFPPSPFLKALDPVFDWGGRGGGWLPVYQQLNSKDSQRRKKRTHLYRNTHLKHYLISFSLLRYLSTVHVFECQLQCTCMYTSISNCGQLRDMKSVMLRNVIYKPRYMSTNCHRQFAQCHNNQNENHQTGHVFKT